MTLSQDIAAGPVDPIADKARFQLVDIVKGLAIFLVAYGHSAQGMEHRGWWTNHLYFFSDNYVYSFHMPAFFFVAGLFLLSSLNRRGWKHFLLEKLKTILYPYVLWAVIGYIVIPPIFVWLYPGAKTAGIGQFFLYLLTGEGQWFLLTLFLCLMLAALTSRLPHWLRFALAIALALFITPNSTGVAYYFPHEFCFLAAGMWAGASIRKIDTLKPSIAAIGFCVVMGVQAVIIHFYGVRGLFTNIYIPLGLMGTLGLFLLARAIEKLSVGKFFVWSGQASLAVYLLSPYTQDAVRIPLARFLHVQSFWPQLILPTLSAFLIPVVIWHRQKQWKMISWFFRWPFS